MEYRDFVLKPLEEIIPNFVHPYFQRELRHLERSLKMKKISCGKKEIILGERTLIMGILNVTPDSFSDGGNIIT